VNVVRDLDDELARRAASIALEDATLDLQIRAELEAVATIPSDAPPLDPVSGVDLGNSDDSAGSGASDPNEARLQAQALDAGALSAESLSGSDERDPLAADITADRVEDFGEDFADQTDELLPEPSRSEVDLDRTPLIDATDEMTSPLLQREPSADDSTTLILARSTPSPSSSASGERPRDHASTGPADGSDSNPVAPLRSIKILDAIPVAMGSEGVEIDASPRGKSKVPFSRIQTIAMVAVDGLGSRPVLVIDILLNGSDGIHAPMKLIRFRSDRFDPLVLEPEAASPLMALLAWIKRIQAGSNAICLPSNRILAGKFSRFDSLEAYERQVLSALRADF